MKHSAGTKNIWVQVTQEDIDRGLERDCFLCPVARAVNRLLRDDWKASVSGGWGRVYMKNEYGRASKNFQSFYLPQKVVDFIHKIDGYEDSDLEPFRFLTKLPKVCLRQGV